MNRALVAVWLLLAACASLPAASAGRPKPPSPSRSWRLAFVRDGDLWVANGDGSGQKLLIKDAEAPAWSPDKKRIAFARGGNVWVANADGGGQRQVTFNWQSERPTITDHASFEDGRAVDIVWDPVRDYLTFSHWEEFRLARADESGSASIVGCSIFEVPLDVQGRDQPEVLFDVYDSETAFHFSNHSHPAWSQDGCQLAFARNGDIWIGLRLHDETADPREADRVDWQVRRLAAVAEYDAPTYRASRENTAVTHLSWSPDGKRLAYDWQRVNGSGTEEIRLLNVETGRSRELATGLEPCFSPDGKWIVYENPYGEGIWATSVDGKTERQLIPDGEQPEW